MIGTLLRRHMGSNIIITVILDVCGIMFVRWHISLNISNNLRAGYINDGC
jgi:hypothetical protein